MKKTPRKPAIQRARDFVPFSLGKLPSGPLNSLTDVSNVHVGHFTLSGKPTGVTAILPNSGLEYQKRVPAAFFRFNGTGEVIGAQQLMEWGLLETPILLTGTNYLGAAYEGAVRYLYSRFGKGKKDWDTVIPLIGECDNTRLLSGKLDLSLKPEHVVKAIEAATAGPIEEGSVGGGAGLFNFEVKSGIGTSSRVVELSGKLYTVGVLVQSNFGLFSDLSHRWPELQKILKPLSLKESSGSIVVIIGTDAPLLPSQLERIARRASFGLARTGSIASHGSGDFFIAFSTQNLQNRSSHSEKWNVLPQSELNELFRASVEATEESIWNALVAANLKSF